MKKAFFIIMIFTMTMGLAFAEIAVEEEDGILLMREEEKLARDVYLGLYDIWELRIFSNIARSEQKHMDAVLTLVDEFSLEDPAAIGGPGEFSDPHLQSLYDDLMEQGSASLTDALLVGATIEDLDIKDLEELLSGTDDPDITRVYENLLAGSENHMRSFIRQIDNRGGEYSVQFISEERFEEILDL